MLSKKRLKMWSKPVVGLSLWMKLTSRKSYGGGAVLDFLLAEMENQVGSIVFFFAGYNREMEKFFEHNPGPKSRVPHQLQFTDYKDEELLRTG